MTTTSTEELELFAKAVEYLPANYHFADAIADWIHSSNNAKVIGTVLNLLKEKNVSLHVMVLQEFAQQIQFGLSRRS